jgi:tetratricopeptide (TPR) repeat protein
MVSAPLMVLLFDRTFISGSLKAALHRSWHLYVGLASTWLVLLFLNLGAPRSDSAGFSLGVSAWQWWLTQTQVLLMYLRLLVWPSPLLLHYDIPYLTSLGQAWRYLVPVLLLAVAVGVLLWQNRPLGFLGTFFFAVLSPTLVVPIVTEIVAERRLYLPLLVPVILVAVGGYSLLQWAIGHQRDLKIGRPIFVCAALVVFVLCGVASANRVKDYDDETTLWLNVLKVQPNNYTAHTHLGRLLLNSGHVQEAINELQLSLARKPDNYLALNTLGVALDHLGRYDEAIKVQNEALRVNPNYTDSLQNIANSLRDVGRFAEAKVQLEKALQLRPDDAEAQNNMGVLLARQNEIAKAIERFRLATQLNPRYAAAHINLGKTLATSGEVDEAMRELQTAIRLQPSRADLHNELGAMLGQKNQNELAAEQFQWAVELDPKLAQAYSNLAMALALMNRSAEAIANAQRGIEVARATGQLDTATAAEEWLRHYRNELNRVEAKTK